jgi:hypothetical protein
VRRQVVRAAVGLDLDDPALAPTGRVVTDESRAKEDASDLGSVAREVGSVQDAQAARPG